ncbi:PKD domain-containing protein [Arthrobacter sp. H20]|uniref:PKD domain-containing protein n=1 Tax=Arthrobacter sp. H20 TaxID=1267981 RepID=UPI0004B77986|nr:PKD domain-containing protein [Arthrobacter sp. H20]
MRRFISILLGLLMVAGFGVAIPGAATASEQTLSSVVRSTPVNYTPHVLDGIVFSIAEAGDTIVLGGSFTRVQASAGGPVLTRNGVVAFNKNNGQISAGFAPQFNSTVRSVVAAPDGQSVYVGGQFGTLNGASTSKVVRLALSNGARITAFNAGNINAVVHDMKLSGNRLFIGGEFAAIRSQARTALAELDPTTGALRTNTNITFAGTHNGGTTFVHKFDVTPDGQTMVVTGNFTSMNGLDRVQVGMVDLSATNATVANWQSDRWKPNCYSVFAYYLNDLDIAPDGSYFVLGSMGGYGSGPPTLCDTVSRWEMNDRGAALNPIWSDYTGGDSVYALEATGDTVYFGGHNRWMNNPFRADAAGQGAVEREGMGALSALSGLPMKWNPGRDRGRGVFDLLATSQGLWVGSDTDRIARFLYRARIAMFPLAGGTAIPTATAPALPVDVLQSGKPSGSVDPRYLYRVNAGGSSIASIDAGPDWVGDIAAPGSTYRNTGNAATYAAVPQVTGAVLAGTPREVFSTERWDSASAPEMKWSFPVTTGKNVQVRIYLADRCSCTQANGSRVFSMTVDGQMAFGNYDINASVGHDTGTVLTRDITSDGTVDVEFLHVTENPLVNAIEIFDRDAPVPDPGQANQLSQVYFTGNEGVVANPNVTGAVAWDSVRGGFVAAGSMYLAMSNGELHQRSFNGSQIGGPTVINLNGLANFASEMQSMTGLFYSNGRIYFTLAGQTSLFMRHFEIDSGIVGAQRFTIAGPTGGMTWSSVRGMFLAGDTLYWASADGNLNALDWTESVGDGTVSGTSAAVSGPALDGTNWTAKGLIAKPGTAPPPANGPPSARFSQTCDGLECTFNGAGSTDSDGTVDSYAWTSSDGGSGTAAVFTRKFASAGTYDVTLTVTDNDGATSPTTQEVTVSAAPPVNKAPTASFTDICEDLTCTFDGSGSSDPDGAVSGYAWAFEGGPAAEGEVVTRTFAAAGSYNVTLTVTDNAGATGTVSRAIVVSGVPDPTTPVAFVASTASSNTGSVATHSVTVPAQVRAGDVMVAMFSTNSGTVGVTHPSGWIVSAEGATTSMRSVMYGRLATAADAGSTVSVRTATFNRGTLVITVYRGAQIAGASFDLETETISRAQHTTPTLPAAAGDWVLSYWADKTAGTSSWAAPGGVTVRQTGAGTGAGHMSWLAVDSNGPVSGTTAGGLTATANSATGNAVMGTVVIKPGAP